MSEPNPHGQSGVEPDALHVVPVNDSIDHDTSGEQDCACEPTTESVTRDDGSKGSLVVHRSLDGREAHE